jgi:hypothetical protein
MSTWRAKCWLGSEVGYQECEVQSNTIHGAKAQMERIYGAEEVINLREVNDSTGSGSKSSGLSTSNVIAILFLLGGSWLLITYTSLVVMSVLGILGAWVGSKTKNGLIAIALTVGLGAWGFHLGTGWHADLKTDSEATDEIVTQVKERNTKLNSVEQIDNTNEGQSFTAPELNKINVQSEQNESNQFSRISKKEADCLVWKQKYPAAAAKLKPDDACY